MIATSDEIINLFKTPLTTFNKGAVIQKIILGAAAIGNDTLSAKRALALLEQTELRALFLLIYPHISISKTELGHVESLMYLKNALLPYDKVTVKCIAELEEYIPRETSTLLRDYLVKESPLYYVAVNIFIVVTMVLIEAGEL